MTASRRATIAEPPSRRALFEFRWRPALLIFLLALAFRGLYLWEASRRPDFNQFNMDQEYNLDWARCLASGHWPAPYDRLRDAPYFRGPLYSYFLAGLLTIFGGSTLLARIAQIVIGSISCALAYALGTRCFGRRVGVITGVLCSLYWVLAYSDVEFLQPVLLVFFALLGFLALFAAADRKSPPLAALAGLSLGLYAITRPEILIFVPLAIVWFAWALRDTPRPRTLWLVALLAAGCLLPPAAATVRNRVVGGDWVVIASQGGVNFYIGNNPQSNGMQAVVPGTRPTWWGGFEDTEAIAERAAGRKLAPSEVSRYWFGRGFAFIREQPAAWLRLTARKAVAFVGNVEVPNNKSEEEQRRVCLTLRIVPLNFGLLFGLFAAALPALLGVRGFAADARQARYGRLLVAFVAVSAATVIAFFVTGRYRVPLVPFVAIGAAVTLVRFADLLKARRFLRAGMLFLIAAALAGALSPDYFDVRRSTRAWVTFVDANTRLAAGDLDGAIGRLEEIRRERSMPIAQLYSTLARAYVRRGRVADQDTILQIVDEGLRVAPVEPELLWYAAAINMEKGRKDEAAAWVDRYLERVPGDVQALRLAFFAALGEHRAADARRYLERAEAVDKANPLVVSMRRRWEQQEAER